MTTAFTQNSACALTVSHDLLWMCSLTFVLGHITFKCQSENYWHLRKVSSSKLGRQKEPLLFPTCDKWTEKCSQLHMLQNCRPESVLWGCVCPVFAFRKVTSHQFEDQYRRRTELWQPGWTLRVAEMTNFFSSNRHTTRPVFRVPTHPAKPGILNLTLEIMENLENLGTSFHMQEFVWTEEFCLQNCVCVFVFQKLSWDFFCVTLKILKNPFVRVGTLSMLS